MKKAKEYAEMILVGNQDESIKKTADEMIREISELSRTRNVSSNSALKAIVVEQNKKWKAVCKIVNKDEMILSETGFMMLLERVIPETKELMNE